MIDKAVCTTLTLPYVLDTIEFVTRVYWMVR